MTHTQQKLLIISLIVLSTTAGHLFSMNLKYTSISGDEQWYTYNAVYFLGSVIRGCRAIFGEHATCGVQYPSHHPFLQEVFEQTGMNRYLAGEIDFETFLGVADGLEIDKFETLSRYKLRNPLEIILSRGNLTAITLGMSMWIFGSNYAGFLILQTFIIGLSIAIIFQLGYYFSNAWGGTLAAMIWGFYTFFQLQENVIPQASATTLLTLGFLCMSIGMTKKRVAFLFIGCVITTLSTFFAIGLRLSILLLMTVLLIGYYGWKKDYHLMAAPLTWASVIAIFVISSFFFACHHLNILSRSLITQAKLSWGFNLVAHI